MKKFPQVLGYAGALPFLGLALAISGVENDGVSLKLFAVLQLIYAALILSFLGGVHWPEALKERDNLRLCLAMVPTILGFGLLIWGVTHDPIQPLLGAILLFWFVFVMDKKYYDGRTYPDGYLPFRFNLTLLVTALLFFSYLSAS